MRHGDLPQGNPQGKPGHKPHKDVEATIIHHSNTYTSTTATNVKPFTDNNASRILLSNPAARNC